MTAVLRHLIRHPWFVASGAAVVFALSVPATTVWPIVGHLCLVGQLVAIAAPACRHGHRGAWGGALLSLTAFAAADIADGLARSGLAGVPSDLLLVGVMSGVLASALGAIGQTVGRHRALAEQAKASERRYHELLNSLPTGLLVLTPELTIELANGQAATLLDAQPSCLAGRSLETLVAKKDWPRLGALLRTPQPGLPLRATLVAPSGRQARTDWVCAPHATQAGPRTLAYCWDAEDTIREEEATSRVMAALRCLQEGVVLADLDGRIQYANAAAARMYGHAKPEEMLSAHLSTYVSPAASGDSTRRLATEIPLRQADGTEIPVRVTTSPVLLDGTQVGTVGVVTDLSHQKEMAHRAATADKLATLGRLVAGAAHEINNPLAAVLANAELLQAGPASPEDLRASVQVIVEESRRAGNIVRGLLSFARQQPVARSNVNLHSLVCDVLALRAGYVKARGIDVRLEGNDSDVIVRADADQLKQVLLNLVVNAEDAVRDRVPRKVTVKVSRVGAVGMVFVDDSGSGVPESLRERIFEPFFTTKPQGHGTGLGLSVSYGIVREHGGSVWAETAPLGGARFVVQLPVAVGAAGQPAAPTRRSNPSLAATGRRVLVVDDEPAIRDAARRILTRFGHHVSTAASGAEALPVARSTQFDVIISDLRMPGLSGQELYAALEREQLLKGARFVVATGDIADAQSAEFVRLTDLQVLLKPFELVALLEVVSGASLAAAA
jgi:PAS domain S-box-containing protein